MNSKNTMQRDA